MKIHRFFYFLFILTIFSLNSCDSDGISDNLDTPISTRNVSSNLNLDKDNILDFVRNQSGYFDQTSLQINYDLAEIVSIVATQNLIVYIPIEDQQSGIVDVVRAEYFDDILTFNSFSELGRNSLEDYLFKFLYDKKNNGETRTLEDAFQAKKDDELENRSSQIVQCTEIIHYELIIINDPWGNSEISYVETLEVVCRNVGGGGGTSPYSGPYSGSGPLSGGAGSDNINDISIDDCLAKYQVTAENEADARLMFQKCGECTPNMAFVSAGDVSFIESTFTNCTGSFCQKFEDFYVVKLKLDKVEVPCGDNMDSESVLSDFMEDTGSCYANMEDIFDFMDEKYGTYVTTSTLVGDPPRPSDELTSTLENLFDVGEIVDPSTGNGGPPLDNPVCSGIDVDEVAANLSSEVLCGLVSGDNSYSFCSDESLDEVVCGIFSFNEINSETDFNEALEQYDYITIVNQASHCKDGETQQSMREDCPRLANILSNLIGDNPTNPKCDMLSVLGASEDVETQFLWDCDNTNISEREDGSQALGQVAFSSESLRDKTLKVYFNRDICSESCLKIASVILHESLHAEMLTKILTDLPSPDPWSGTFATGRDAQDTWNDISGDEYDGENNQHRIMARFYAEEYAKAMHEMTISEVNPNGIGIPDDYLFWAYDGLGIPIGDPLLPQTEWDDMTNGWNSISSSVSDEFDVNCN